MKKKYLCAVCAVLACCLMLPLLGGCGKEEPETNGETPSAVKAVYYGENGEIPCVELDGMTYATAGQVTKIG